MPDAEPKDDRGPVAAVMRWLAPVTQTLTVAALVGGAAWATALRSEVVAIRYGLDTSNALQQQANEHNTAQLAAMMREIDRRFFEVDKRLERKDREISEIRTDIRSIQRPFGPQQ